MDDEWGGRPRLRLRDLERLTTALTVAAGKSWGGDAAAFKRRRIEIGESNGGRGRARHRDRLIPASAIPWVIIGTIRLWNDGFCCHSSSGHAGDCFAIVDDTGVGCCLLKNVDLELLGSVVVITSFNYIPSSPHLKRKDLRTDCVSVYLEVHEIHVLKASSSQVHFPRLCVSPAAADVKNEMLETPPLKLKTRKTSRKARLTLCGRLHCLSPSFSLPCRGCSISSTKCLFDGEGTGDQQVLKGFLVELGSSSQEPRSYRSVKHVEEGEQVVRVYFSGSLSAWRPVLLNYIGSWIRVTGLRKKIINVGPKDVNLLMTATRTTLVSQVPPRITCPASPSSEKGLGSYVGVVTKLEFEGRLVELDETVVLLLTHQENTVLHGLRIGATLLAQNVHMTVVYWGWRRCVVLGACFRSSVKVARFSPLCTNILVPSRTVCFKKLQRLSFVETFGLLRTALDLREKLGRNSDIYDHLQTPLTRVSRDGVKEFLYHHRSCFLGGKEEAKTFLQRTPPFREVDNYLRQLWKNSASFIWQHKEKRCSNRCIIPSEDVNFALLGRLEVCRTSGTLHLCDLAHKIDVIIPDLHSSIILSLVYKISKFVLVVEASHGTCRYYVVFSSKDAYPCQTLERKLPDYTVRYISSLSDLPPPSTKIKLRGRVVAVSKLVLVYNKFLSKSTTRSKVPVSGISASFGAFLIDDGTGLAECWAYGTLADHLLGLQSQTFTSFYNLLCNHDCLVYEKDHSNDSSQGYELVGDRRMALSESEQYILDLLATRACDQSPMILICETCPIEFGNKFAIIVRAVEQISYVREGESLCEEIEQALKEN